ncbi:MAG: type II and III secretion system protein family protein [Gemmatimonadota bacterium]
MIVKALVGNALHTLREGETYMRNRSFGVLTAVLLIAGLAASPAPTDAQSAMGETQVLNVALGNSTVVTHPVNLERVMITDPNVADAVPVTAREVVINGLRAGTTTLLFWDSQGIRHTYSVHVTADVRAIQSEIQRILPGNGVSVAAVGNSIVLTGEVSDPHTASRAVSLAQALSGEAEILDYISTPDPGQVMLRVRVAEVSRSAIQDLGINLMRVDPNNLRGDDEISLQSGGVNSFGGSYPGTGPDLTFSDAVNFYLFHRASNVAAFIQALQGQGVYRSLAEPNLITVPGEEASFLAGGEFPYPMIQPTTGQVTVQFREFGILLDFTPTITNSGSIRLHVAPEVSSLDFASGVSIGGSVVPALLSRRAETTIELEDGQTFAIAGLLDSDITESVNKVPLLGDIPILGAFFRSTEARENQTEILVLVTPHFVRPMDEMPEIPTGELDVWPWGSFMTDPLRVVPTDPVSDGTN